MMEKYLFSHENYQFVKEDTLGGSQWNVNMVTKEIGSPFDAGITEYRKGEAPCLFEHDDYGDVIYVIEGFITVKSNKSDDVITAHAGDVVYLIQEKGLKMEVGAPEGAKVFWVAYPNAY